MVNKWQDSPKLETYFKTDPFDPCLCKLREHLRPILQALVLVDRREDGYGRESRIGDFVPLAVGLFYCATGDHGYNYMWLYYDTSKLKRSLLKSVIVGTGLCYAGLPHPRAQECIRIGRRVSYQPSSGSVSVQLYLPNFHIFDDEYLFGLALLSPKKPTGKYFREIVSSVRQYAHSLSKLSLLAVGAVSHQTGADEVLSLLEGFLREYKSGENRGAAALAIGMAYQGTGNENAISAVSSLLHSENQLERELAAISLGLIWQAQKDANNRLKNLRLKNLLVDGEETAISGTFTKRALNLGQNVLTVLHLLLSEPNQRRCLTGIGAYLAVYDLNYSLPFMPSSKVLWTSEDYWADLYDIAILVITNHLDAIWSKEPDALVYINNVLDVFGEKSNRGIPFLAFYGCTQHWLNSDSLEKLVTTQEDLEAAIIAMHDTFLFESVIQVLESLRSILDQLDKAQRVSGVRDKQNYYLKALDVLAEVRQLVESDLYLAFQIVMRRVIDHFDKLIRDASRQLRERVELQVSLLSLERPLSDQVDVALKLVNPTISTASNVSVTVIPSSSNYEIIKGEVPISFIPAEGEAQVQCIIRPLREDAVRIAGVVRYDDLENKGKELPFADVITFTGAEPFRKPPLNPYVAGPPIRTPEGFYGRGELIETIRRDLQGTVQDNIIALYGQRRTGKTSLLHQLKHRLQPDYLPVHISMEGIGDKGMPAFFTYRLAYKIHDALHDVGLSIQPPEESDFAENPYGRFQHRFLRQVRSLLDQRRLLLMIDEFEGLEEGVKSGCLEPQLFRYLRDLMQSENWISFIFCGAHLVQELSRDYRSIFFNLVIPRRVTFLSEQEAQALITKPAAEYFAYDELAAEKIYRLTHGHPYFIQLLCHILVNHVRRSPVVNSDVDAALRDLIDTGNEHLDWIWAQSTSWEKTILWALTKLESRGVVILSDITAFWRERGKTVAEEDLNQAITQLVERELVRRDENRVAFTMGLIPAWIAHCQSEQNVRQEVLK